MRPLSWNLPISEFDSSGSGLCWTGKNFPGEARTKSEKTFSDDKYIFGERERERVRLYKGMIGSYNFLEVERDVNRKMKGKKEREKKVQRDLDFLKC